MIASVRRVFSILSCFTQEEPVLGNAEIAEKLNLSRSTTHHLITTLCNEGILIRDAQRKYRLGWRLLELSNSVMYQYDFYNKALPLVKQMTDRFDATAHIGMFDQGDVVITVRMTSNDTSDLPTYLGARKPAYCTSLGKILLAYNDSYLKVTAAKGFSKQGTNTITSSEALKKELKTIREQGYAISKNENDTSTYAIAAPIQTYSGKTIAAVNLVGPVHYMESLPRGQIIQSVVNTAKSISRELGYIEI